VKREISRTNYKTTLMNRRWRIATWKRKVYTLLCIAFQVKGSITAGLLLGRWQLTNQRLFLRFSR
jgi:hypothetical protein